MGSNFVPFLWQSLSKRIEPMAREANPIKTELITLSLNAQTLWYLDQLVELGFYGNNRTEAARIVIYDHCKLLVADRKLRLARPPVDLEMSAARQSTTVARR
jgi:hypothetical protein